MIETPEEVLHNPRLLSVVTRCKSLKTRAFRFKDVIAYGVCDNHRPTARKLLILKRPAPSERSESRGEMSEWLKEHAWKACVGETLPRVRIPLSPPISLAALAHWRSERASRLQRRASHVASGIESL